MIELKQTPTTIWVKKGTKELLDTFGERKDTYDEIIRKIIRENMLLKQKKEKSSKKTAKNRFKITFTQTMNSRLDLSNSEYIEYIYQKPIYPIDPDFRFFVTYIKVVYNNKKRKVAENYKNPIDMAKDYLKIIEKIIQKHLDPLFKIDQKHILDYNWWERKLKNLGFSEKTYFQDIEFELTKLEIIK